MFQLLDACVSNCGKTFHLEVASRDFETEFRKLLSRSQPRVAEKLRQLLKKWAEGDFRNDAQLNLIPSLYAKLKQEGIDFTVTSETVKVKKIPFILKIK
jgi:signal transducing adaptor molecule